MPQEQFHFSLCLLEGQALGLAGFVRCFKFLGYWVLFFKTSLFRIGVWGLGVTLEGLEGFNTGFGGFRVWGWETRMAYSVGV